MAKNAGEKLELDEPVEPTIAIDTSEEDDETEGAETERAAADDGGAEEQARAPRERDPATGKWKARKQERGRQNRERQEGGLRAELDARFRRIEDSHREEVAQLRRDLAQARQPAGAQPPADPYAGPIGDLNKQINAELKLIEGDPKYGYDRYNELVEKKNELIAERVAMRVAQKNAQQQPQGRPNPYDNRIPFIEAEFPWTRDARYADLARKAGAHRAYLIQFEGRPDTIETDREALMATVARFGAEYGLRAPAAPSQRTRAIYQGPAAGSGPVRGERPAETEVEVPRALAAASGLSASALRAALRSTLPEG
jgi:hypothetical protein